MEVTHEGSMAVYNRLLESPPAGPLVPFKEPRRDVYSVDGRSVVAIVRSESRREGINEAVGLVGGFEPIVRGVEGEILIKPNCNTDDPYPRDTHPDTVRAISEGLITCGFPAERIVLGETSGMARGLPTRRTLTNLGMKRVADNLGMRDGLLRGGRVGDGQAPRKHSVAERHQDPEERLRRRQGHPRPHHEAPQHRDLHDIPKLAVGMLDSVGREWLHDGVNHLEKLVELNLAYSADLIVADATEILIDRDLTPPGLRGRASS